MSFDFENARDLMVENQLRPNKINNPVLLNIFKNTKKEDFIEEPLKKISYFDSDINLDSNRGYLKTLHIAQMIEMAEINSEDKILHIGGMTGYVSSLLAQLCKYLFVLETKTNFLETLKKNLNNLNLINVNIVNSDFQEGYLDKSPYDIIFIDNPIKNIPKLILDQVSNKNGKIIMIKKTNNYLCKAYKITKNNNEFINHYLFDVFTKYQLYKEKEDFIF